MICTFDPDSHYFPSYHQSYSKSRHALPPLASFYLGSLTPSPRIIGTSSQCDIPLTHDDNGKNDDVGLGRAYASSETGKILAQHAVVACPDARMVYWMALVE